jgi:aryl-alcohol dehydrogenase-like predicted oxidoreductase
MAAARIIATNKARRPMPISHSLSSTVKIGDVTVQRLGFGAMRITGPQIWGPPKDRNAALQVLRRAVELGVDFIDTADAYGPGTSEELIAEALAPYPEGLIIATKGGLTRPSPGEWRRDARPEHLRAACEASLKRLRLQRIDLYQLHSPDPSVPLAESVGALVDLQRQGKIRHIGLSNVNERELETARAVGTIVSVQNRYNLSDRRSDGVLAVCERDGLAFLPWYPLGAGDDAARARGPLAQVAQLHGATPAQAVLGWLLARSPVMLPIPGTSSVRHLEENVAARGVALTARDIAALG